MRPTLGLGPQFHESAFLTNASTAFAYTIASQAISVLVAPALSRLYSPSEFGLFGMFTAFVSAASVTTCLNYETALPSAQDEEEKQQLAYGAAAIAVVMGSLLSLTFLAASKLDILGYGVLPGWATPLVVGFLFSAAAVAIPQYSAVRDQRFTVIGQANLFQSTVRAVVQVAGGALGLTWSALALGEISGRVASLARYASSASSFWFQRGPTPSMDSVFAFLKKERRFPIIMLPAMLIDQALVAVTVPLVTITFGLASGGQYF